MLATEKRQNEDPRSFGELFHLCYDEIADIQFSEALKLVLGFLHSVLQDCLFLSEQQMNEIIDRFIEKLSVQFKMIFTPVKQAA